MYAAAMFPFGLSSSEGGIDPEKEREAPPPPTLIYFPHWDVPLQMKRKWTVNDMPDLYGLYSKVQKPADVNISHLEYLNLTIHNDVSLEHFLPPTSDGSLHIPSPAWNRVDSKGTFTVDKKNQKVSLLSNGSKAPTQEAYVKLAKELCCENEDAFRVLDRRRARAGRPAPHLAHFRKFWTQLQSMSMYWDTSLDNYFDVEVIPQSPKTPSKGGKKPSFANLREHHNLHGLSGSPGTVKRYTGRRTGNGERMPDHFRVDTVRQFLEPIALSFGCQLANPRRLPQLEVRSLLVPVTQTALIWRTPNDKTEAKKGYVEGPVIGIQCRGETDFASSRHESIVDLAREIAGLFLLAGERAREGKPRKIPGAGKWYTAKPRWGGGPGGEFGEAEGNTDTGPMASRKNSGPNAGVIHHRSEEEIWRELTPGPGIWEPRTTYLSIGRAVDDRHDQIFMVSALFHHISIVKLQVHPAYMDFLTLGKTPDPAVLEDEEFYPIVFRTKWYDLLLASERLEALRAVWGVLSYNMRAQALPPAESTSSSAAAIRRKSDMTSSFPFRKKSYVSSPTEALQPQRRSTVFF